MKLYAMDKPLTFQSRPEGRTIPRRGKLPLEDALDYLQEMSETSLDCGVGSIT